MRRVSPLYVGYGERIAMGIAVTSRAMLIC